MTTIGRVFTVLNLVLAAVFFWSAGTYLQHHTDYKNQLGEVTTAKDKEIENYQQKLAANEQDLNDKTRQLTQAQTTLQSANAEVTRLTADNERLQKQLSSVEKDIKTIQSNLASMESSIATAAQQAQEGLAKALEASVARDEALRSEATAKADLTDAQQRIGQLESQLGEANTQIAQRDEQIEELDILVGIARRNNPELFQVAQPSFGGRVTNVGPNGRLLTVALDNAERAKPGYTMAIHQNGTYKGEARITEVSGSSAFLTLTNDVPGTSIQIGDAADSQVN